MKLVETLLHEKRLILCLGSGGVGKTTTAAALAVRAANLGRRALVLTIDPAPRLKDLLGLPTMGTDPQPVSLPGRGSLHALVLDVKGTFDNLIGRFAPSPGVAQRILHNRLYQNISSRLAGSHEYMAMEKLYELAISSRFDTMIIDTPPSRHARDFLRAPHRLLNFLNSRALIILRHPSVVVSHAGSRFVQYALTAILKGLERFTGLTLLQEISEFVGSFEEMSGGFRDRADAALCLLRHPTTAFLLVATPDPLCVQETLDVSRQLQTEGLPFTGVVMNRSLPRYLLRAAPAPTLSLPFVSKLQHTYQDFHVLARRYRHVLRRLKRELPAGVFVAEVPLLEEEPTSFGGLTLFINSLFSLPGEPGERGSSDLER